MSATRSRVTGLLHDSVRAEYMHELGLCPCNYATGCTPAPCGDVYSLPPTASAIREAYRRVLIHSHPDKHLGIPAELRPATPDYTALATARNELVEDVRLRNAHLLRPLSPLPTPAACPPPPPPPPPQHTPIPAPSAPAALPPQWVAAVPPPPQFVRVWAHTGEGHVEVPLSSVYSGGTVRATATVKLPLPRGTGGAGVAGSGMDAPADQLAVYSVEFDAAVPRGALAYETFSVRVCVADCQLDPVAAVTTMTHNDRPRGGIDYIIPAEATALDELLLDREVVPCVRATRQCGAAKRDEVTTTGTTTTTTTTTTPTEGPRMVRSEHCRVCYVVLVRLRLVDAVPTQALLTGGRREVASAVPAEGCASSGATGERHMPGRYEMTRKVLPMPRVHLGAFADAQAEQDDRRRWVEYYKRRAELHCRVFVHIADAIANAKQFVVHPNGTETLEMRVAEPHCMLDARVITVEHYGMPLYMRGVCGPHGRLADLYDGPPFGNMVTEFVVLKPTLIEWPCAKVRDSVAAQLHAYARYADTVPRVGGDGGGSSSSPHVARRALLSEDVAEPHAAAAAAISGLSTAAAAAVAAAAAAAEAVASVSPPPPPVPAREPVGGSADGKRKLADDCSTRKRGKVVRSPAETNEDAVQVFAPDRPRRKRVVPTRFCP